MSLPRHTTTRVAIVGPTGYTGLELIQLLVRHPAARLTYLASHRDELPDITDEFPKLRGCLASEVAQCRPIDAPAIAADADVCFVALPHRAAMAHVPALLDAGLRVVDLSADYRLHDPDLYRGTYEHPHEDRDNLARAVYGLPELFRDRIPSADLVANPGCYPTAAALALAPLLSRRLIDPDTITINAASGVSGAGRTPSPRLHFPEQNEAFGPYGRIGAHRHQPEIEQTLTTVAGQPVGVRFVPHLLPINRGILESIYCQPAHGDVTEAELVRGLRDAYEHEPFVRVTQELPNIAHVAHTNFCDLGLHVIGPPDQPSVVVFGAIDNLIKGAAGQAVQNMNLMAGYPETTGLLPDPGVHADAAMPVQ